MSQNNDTAPLEPCEEGSPRVSRRRAFLNWLDERKGPLSAWALGISLLVLLVWPYMIITIQPGHVGVLYKRFLGGTVMDVRYGEGTHVVLPWDTMHIFDARLHEELFSCTVPTQNGMLISLDVTAYYHPVADKTPVLLTTVGKDYREKLVLPSIESAVRGVVSGHDLEDFFSERSNLIQDQIHVNMLQSIGRHPIIIDGFFIRAVKLPQDISLAINAKMIARQNVQEAKERYKARFIEAQSVKMTQETVSAGLSESFLRWQGIEATKKLAESANAKIVVVGGKDGLPLILNAEGTPASASTPPLAPAGKLEAPTGQQAPISQSAPDARKMAETAEQQASFAERVAQQVIDAGASGLDHVFGSSLSNSR